MNTGKIAGVMRSTWICESIGKSPVTSATRFCTCCSATIMSVDAANCAEISAAPRMLRDRTRLMPGTLITASSSGRVTVNIIDCGGSVPEWTTMTMRGN
jgi:hypothetical protein